MNNIKEDNTSAPPHVSIIIPTYNRPDRLHNCLTSITELKGLGDRVQTIVVNDGSTCSYKTVIEPFQETLNLVYLEQHNQGPATARNHGAKHAKNSFLVFLDDDCTLPPQWFTEVEKHTQSDYVVGGHTENKLDKNICAQASQLLIDYIYNHFNNDPEHATFITSNNLIIPKHIFESLNGFDLDFAHAAAEDRDFCDRVVHNGFDIKYRPSIVINHYHNMTLRGYFRQHYNYGYSALLYHRKKQQRSGKGLSVEQMSFYIQLLLYPYKMCISKPVTISSLFIISQIANTLGFLHAKWSSPSAKEGQFVV